MPRSRPNAFTFFWTLACLCLHTLTVAAAEPQTTPVQGIRVHVPNVHALTSARIVVAPGQVIEKGTVVINAGVITHVGADIDIPHGARKWDLAGRTIYPGFIDAYSVIDLPKQASDTGAPYWNRRVSPQADAARHYKTDPETNKKLRSQGIAARLLVPGSGIIQGTSALVSTGDGQVSQSVLATDVALHMKLTTPFDVHGKEYPKSPMGAVALARQAMYDAAWYRQSWQTLRANASLPQPEWNDALQVLQDYVDSSRLVVIDTENEQFLLRADEFAREFGLRIAISGSGHEYRRLAAVQEAGRPLIVPVNFPKAPNVVTPEAALNASLAQLMHWDLAPDNPAQLVEAGLQIALTSHGLEDKSTFLKNIRIAVRRGLPADRALQALTETPADLLGISERLGSIRSGKIANLIVTDGDLFETETKLLETWVQGKRYEVKEQAKYDLRRTWTLTHTDQGPQPSTYSLDLTGEPDALKGSLVRIGQPDGEEDQPAKSELRNLILRGERLGFVVNAEPLGQTGVAQVSLLVTTIDDPSTEESALRLNGEIVWPDGSRHHLEGEASPPDTGEAPEQAADDDAPGEAAETEQTDNEDDEDDNDDESEEEVQTIGDTPATFAVNFPLGAFGRMAPPLQPAHVVFQGATIWTSSDAGILEDGSLLIGGGKILAIGQDIDVPEGAEVVDATGLHITPGIIDCHSHMATDGGINESGQAITAEVRIGDFIDARDISIYRQLAGGVTTANILHGSANPIGGQNQVIKLRWGGLSKQLKFAAAPSGIKFALGENVKQSNWGDEYRTRYPQTRMGVEQIIRDTFRAAVDYRRQWDDWKQNRRGLPPRVDLELQAIGQILAGERWIHCHAYRQDEMLALMRVLEEFGVTIGTFQHVLEGYKIADALARHGAMASAFSDWWAYKFEVYDAIPFNGALMFETGVNVSFNSDSAELARHLNQEAAKAVKYGGVPPEEALKFVTFNPAQQLRIDQFVGSIEPDKHADLAIWTGSPLSNYSRCQQTWIDGRKYFDLDEDKRLREENQRMHAALVQKILALKVPMLDADDTSADASSRCPRHDTFCHPHHR